jgi:glycosyltransferase involved in cell wall biosynthesis
MINIIIPTASRPTMLRTALQSIAAQTAVEEIDQVLVSENGGDRQSEEVCREFPGLPITYIYREQPVPVLEHGRILARDHLQSKFTAYLHDDDWWAPTHLALALASLESHPNASASGAGHFVVSGESAMLNCSGNLFPWFGSHYAPMTAPAPWELTRANVLMAQLLGTIAHYSTLVIRTAALRNAAYVFDLGNPFDTDRMLLFALAEFGPILFHPTPQAFIRNHGAQDCFAFDAQSRIHHMCATTRWMVETNGKSWDIIAKSFAKRMAICPPEAHPTLKALAAMEWCLPELSRHLGDHAII